MLRGATPQMCVSVWPGSLAISIVRAAGARYFGACDVTGAARGIGAIHAVPKIVRRTRVGVTGAGSAA
jgi:hypothetical protein